MIQKIPQTKLVISTNSYTNEYKACFDIFELQPGSVKKIFSSGKTSGSNIGLYKQSVLLATIIRDLGHCF